MKGKKGFNIKGFFTEHIEKIGFGLVALTVVGIWGSEFFGGSWSRTKENPLAMIQKIEEAKAEIEKSRWPEEKKAEFELVDFQEQAETLLRPIDSLKYELSTELFVPLYKPKEPAREPEFLAVESLIANPGHVILALAPDTSMWNDEMMLGDGRMVDGDGEEEEEEEEFGNFSRRDGGGGLGAGPAAGLPRGAGLRGLAVQGDEEFPAASRRGRKSGVAKGAGAGLRMGAMREDGDEDFMGAGTRSFSTSSGQRPKGTFYVAVRGVFPVREQWTRIQKALHLPTVYDAQAFLDILDFELERQQATPGDDPWTKEWETLNILYAKEILKEADGFDEEPFQLDVFDPVMTMPLPLRLFGYWKEHATHPRIKDYEKSPEELEKENAFRQRILEEYEKMHLEEEKLRGPERGGFSSDVHDFRGMVSAMSRQRPRDMDNAYRAFGTEFGGMRGIGMGAGAAKVGGVPGIGANSIGAQLTAEITAVGRLLLFRYFDFDVQPGYAYRYRVKLKLRNPNFERPATEVVDPSITEGDVRWTPYSKPSNAAVMPVSPAYFLKEVEQNPLTGEGSSRRSTVANFSIYEWHRTLGTQVYSTLSMYTLGMFLGGEATTRILDVAEPSLGDDKYMFATEDMLLDVKGDVELVPEEHPLLKLGEKRRGFNTVAAGTTPEAVVLGPGGELRHIVSNGESKREHDLKKYADREREEFKDLEQVEEYENPLDIYGDEMGARAKGGKSRAGGAVSSRNVLRKGGKSAGGMRAGARMQDSDGGGRGQTRGRRGRGG